jgi:hypothetical protein
MFRNRLSKTVWPVAVAAIMLCTLPAWSAQHSKSTVKLPVIQYHPQTHIPEYEIQKIKTGAASTTVAMWNYSLTNYKGLNDAGVMIGRSPFAHGHRTTTIPTYIIPLKITISSKTFDPSTADTCGNTADTLLKDSPIFQNTSSAMTMNGVNEGTTQYIDAFQRAAFVNQTNNLPYHTLLPSNVTILPVQDITSAMGSSTAIISASGTCGELGGIDINTFQPYIEGTLIPSLASSGVSTTNFPIFVLGNVVLYQTTTSNCCILGYHGTYTAGSGAIQTYSATDFDTTGDFTNTGNTSVFAHEVGEWLDDPLGNNDPNLQSWGGIGQVSSCQGNLEVGDPLSGTLFPSQNTSLTTFTFQLQELAFADWFIGQGCPSGGGACTSGLGAGGKFSDNGTFTGNAKACPPGGTN